MAKPEENWENQARYDLETARAMLASGRYLYVLFCSQQCVEKAVKAVIVRRTGEFPPGVHNLLRLCENAGIPLDQDAGQFLGDLSNYHIQTRYPEEMQSLGAQVTPEAAQEVFGRTEEVAQWLFSMLT